MLNPIKHVWSVLKAYVKEFCQKDWQASNLKVEMEFQYVNKGHEV